MAEKLRCDLKAGATPRWPVLGCVRKPADDSLDSPSWGRDSAADAAREASAGERPGCSMDPLEVSRGLLRRNFEKGKGESSKTCIRTKKN